MAEAHPALEPWTERLAARPPWTPWRLSIAIGLVLAALFLASEVAFGRVPVCFEDDQVRVDFRIALVMIAVAAYLPGSLAHLSRGARATIDALAPALRLPPAGRDALRREAGHFPAHTLRWAGWIGVAAMLMVPLATNGTIATWDLRTLWPEAIVHRLLLPAIGWFGGRFVLAMLTESRRLSRIGRSAVHVDLTDLRPLAPITSQGLRQALSAAVLFGLLALLLADTSAAPHLPAVLAVGLVASALLSATALLLPLRGARDAIAAAKQAELDVARAELRAARAGAPGGRSLADVLAWRSFVEAVPEWPFDAPTRLRFALYLAIPLGSWLGGALVERLVDALLP